MPANLTPDYLAAEKRWKEAATPEEKLEALQEMLRTIPKHKGTDKMQADIKRRIAQTRKETQRKKGAARQKSFYHVDKEGAGQVVMAGPPNSGKSALLAALTRADPEVADYPFTTRFPLPGMVPFENVQIQLVDLPPVTREFSEGWLYAIIRTADALLLVVDVSDAAVLDQTQEMLTLLGEANIHPAARSSNHDRPMTAATMIAAKADRQHAREQLGVLQETVGDLLPILPVSVRTGEGLEPLKRRMFEMLDIIRVYSKPPGRKADLAAPFVLRRGSTVLHAAEMIHKDFAAHLKYARLWGRDEYSGQMVARDHVLEDGDIIEVHA